MPPRQSPRSPLGEAIRARRRELGLTQDELAERIGGHVTQSDISRLERGLIALPRVKRLEAIAAALDLEVGVLLLHSGWSEDNDSPLVTSRPGEERAPAHPILEELRQIDAVLNSLERDLTLTRLALRSILRVVSDVPEETPVIGIRPIGISQTSRTLAT